MQKVKTLPDTTDRALCLLMVIVLISYLFTSYNYSRPERAGGECKISASYCLQSYSESSSGKIHSTGVHMSVDLLVLLIMLSLNFRDTLSFIELVSRRETDSQFLHPSINAP
jgi:hypothetical protein